MSIKKYIKELKRRHVFKAGIAYLIVAWVIAEVASLALTTFETPPYIMKTLVFMLGIGFLFNLVFAWIYDVTPDGIKKTKNIDQKAQKSIAKSSRLNKVILVSLSITVILLLFNLFQKTSSNNPENVKGNEITEPIAPLAKSIAILPFKNWSGNDSLEYFVDGMTDEVITRLTKIRDLDKVISRTSVFKYKETTKDISEIAKELKVNYILESSFQKVANRVKIKLTLIEVTSDNAMWTEEVTGEWKSNDVFKIQATVAENVAKKLKLNLSLEEIASIQNKPTENNEAYNIYLQAEFQRRKNDNQSFKNAMPLYEAAIALDEDFVLAYLGLADMWQSGGLVWGLFPELEATNNSQLLLEKALRIDPNNYRAFRNLFQNNFYFNWDFDFCEKNLEKFNKFRPNSTVSGVADYMMKTGRYSQSIKWSNKVAEQFPTLSQPYFTKAKALFLAGNGEESLALLKSKYALYQKDQWYLRESCMIHLYLGNYLEFKRNLALLQLHFSDRAPIHIWYEAIRKKLDNKDAEVTKLIAEIENLYIENKSGSPAWFIAMFYFFIEDVDNGFLWLQRSYDRHEVEMTWLKEEPLLRPYRGHRVYKELFEKMGWPESM